MAMYLTEVFLILVMSTGFHPAYRKKGKKSFLILAFLMLTIVSGIREYSVGADTREYVRIYQNIEYISISNIRYEPGFIIFLKVLHHISDNPSFLLFVSSTICIGTYSLFAYKFSKKPTMSMLLYILLGSYFGQMNTMRQSLAISIISLSFMMVLEEKNTNKKKMKQKVLSALMIILAASFHIAAIVAFLPWVLLIRSDNNEKDSKLTVKQAVFRTLLLAIIGFSAYSLIMRATILILPSYAHYFYGTWSDSNYSASLFKTMIDVVFLVIGAFFMNRKKLTYLQRFGVIMVGLSIIFSALSMRMEIWGRLSGIFSVYTYLIWVPEFLNEVRSLSNRRILEVGIFTFAFAYMMIVLIFRPEWTLVVPYLVHAKY